MHISGNRDERVRAARMSSSSTARMRANTCLPGIHRCMGNRLANCRKILWEEILRRFRAHRGDGEPDAAYLGFRQLYRAAGGAAAPEPVNGPGFGGFC